MEVDPFPPAVVGEEGANFVQVLLAAELATDVVDFLAAAAAVVVAAVVAAVVVIAVMAVVVAVAVEAVVVIVEDRRASARVVLLQTYLQTFGW